MSVLDLFAGAARELRWRNVSTNPRDPAYWLTRLFGGQMTSSGIAVTDDLALSVTTVYSATRNLSEDVGSVACPVYVDDDGDRGGKARKHPVYRIFNRAANPEMAAVTFRETIQGHAILRGNGYSEIQFDAGMRPVALWPLDPRKMRLVRAGRDVTIAGAPDGQLIYLYTLPTGQQKPFHPDRIYHLPGFGGNGLQGYSFLRYAAESIAAAAAARSYTGSFFANDATPSLLLKSKEPVSDNTKKDLRSTWEEMHRPLENKHRLAILEGGLEVEKIGVNPEEAQLLDFRKFARSDIAEWIRMPPDKVGDFDRMTFSNAEHSDIFYVKYTLRAWFVRWDQQTNRKLLEPGFIAEHLADSFLQGDIKTRSGYYSEGFAGSNLVPNEARRLENRPRSEAPGADELWFPLAMKPASAFDANGMTLNDRATAASVLIRAGADPKTTFAFFGFDDIKHTGLVPVTIQLDPAILTDSSGSAPAQGGTSA